jgi:guanine deaminase
VYFGQVSDGKIVKMGPGAEEPAILQAYSFPSSAVKRLAEGEFLMPGLIDTHVHAPQVRSLL